MGRIFRYQITIITFMLLLTGTTVLGQDKSSATLPLAKMHSLEIGPEVYYFNYRELESLFGIEGFTKMEEKGVFYGVIGSYTYRGWAPASNEGTSSDFGGLMFRAEVRYAQGKVDYDGATWAGEAVTISDIDDRTMEFRPLVGLDSANMNSINTIYTGFGYRYLNDDLSDFIGGYERESNYYYLPIGINYTLRRSGDWFVVGTLEFDFLLRGLQRSHLSDLGYQDVENKQSSGYGLRSSFKFEKRGKINFVIEPFVRVWHVDESEINELYGVFEPENETGEIGINCIIRF